VPGVFTVFEKSVGSTREIFFRVSEKTPGADGFPPQRIFGVAVPGVFFQIGGFFSGVPEKYPQKPGFWRKGSLFRPKKPPCLLTESQISALKIDVFRFFRFFAEAVPGVFAFLKKTRDNGGYENPRHSRRGPEKYPKTPDIVPPKTPLFHIDHFLKHGGFFGHRQLCRGFSRPQKSAKKPVFPNTGVFSQTRGFFTSQGSF